MTPQQFKVINDKNEVVNSVSGDFDKCTRFIQRCIEIAEKTPLLSEAQKKNKIEQILRLQIVPVE